MIEHLPSDWRQAILVGRILTREGPTPVVVADGQQRPVRAKRERQNLVGVGVQQQDRLAGRRVP
jgi:fumarylacetoacetate (FAA) hydrolase family protein